MTLTAILLFAASLLLSAFFSGCETGLYRIPRLRLVNDSLSGKRWSRVLLGLTNNPSLFVATTLVGNNLANYLSGLSIVLLAQIWFGQIALVELVAPILLSPVVFVYGELLPKNLFFQAPYGLLSQTRASVRRLHPTLPTVVPGPLGIRPDHRSVAWPESDEGAIVVGQTGTGTSVAGESGSRFAATGTARARAESLFGRLQKGGRVCHPVSASARPPAR